MDSCDDENSNKCAPNSDSVEDNDAIHFDFDDNDLLDNVPNVQTIFTSY